MIPTKTVLLSLLVVLGAGFVGFWVRAERKARGFGRPTPFELAVGAVTDFLDTLGIGSFATTTTGYRWARHLDDRLIPGTLNVGHAIPTVAQALIYISIVQVEPRTLALLIAAAVLGALVGSRVVSRWPRRTVRLGMGGALLLATGMMVASAAGALPRGGDATGLSGRLLAIAVAGNFLFGASMCAGVGLYAPCMVLVSLLGMNPTTAFPIMMGSCAFLMPAAGAEFIRRRAYEPRAALGLALGGTPAVLVAAFVVRSLPLDVVRWLVAAAALHTGVVLLVTGLRSRD